MYRQFKILATLMLLAAACTTMHAQYSQQSFDTRKASELYDERGYQTSGAITVDGSLAISNSNGNVSYAYPISQTAVSGFSLTVSLAYCGSLSYVTYKDYASGNVYDPYARWNRFHENRPGWIISVGPFAVQVLSSNGMFHCDPAKFSGAARDSFSDRDMQWCAEGYDVCNRMENLAAETQQVQEEGYVDVISLLRGDGSVLKLYNRRDWSVDGDASMRSDLYTGYYISPEANSHGYALVSWDSAGWPEHVRDFVESRITPTYPYMPRVLRYYSGDGLEYVFHERVAANGLRSYGGAELAVPDQFGAMKAVPSIFYLEQINSTAGAIVWQIGRSRHYDPRTVTTLNQGNIFDPIFTTIHDSTVGRALTTDIGGVHITYGDIGFTIEANGRTTKAIIGRIQTNGNAPAAVNSMPLASRGYFTRTAEGLAALNETGGASSSLYEGYMGYVTEIIDPEGRSTKFTYEPYTRTYVNENYPVPNPVGTDLKLSLTNQRLKRIDEPTASYTISYAGGDINTYGDLVREDTVRAATIRADDPTNVNYPFLLNNVASVVRKYDHNGTLLTEQKCEYSHSAGDGFWKGLLTTTDKVANTSRTNTYLYRIHPMPDSIRIVWEPKPRYTELYHTEESGAGVTTVTTTTTEQMPCSPYVWLPTHTETSVAGITTSRRTFSYGFDTARTYGGDARLTRLFGIETKRSITRTLDPATSALRLVDTTDFVHMPMLDTTLWRLDTFLNKFATLGNYFRLRDSGVIRGPWEWAMYDPRVAVFTLDSAYEHAYVPPHYGLVARDVLADSSGGILGGMQTEYTGAQATIRHVNDLLYRGMPARSFVISAGGTSTVLASGRLFSNTNGMDVPIVDTNANGAVHRDFYESYGSLKLRQNGNYYPRASVLRNDGTTKDTLLPEDSYFSVLFNKPLINEVYVRKYDPSGSGLLMTDTMLQLHQYGFFGLATGAVDYNGNYATWAYDRNGRLRTMWSPGDVARTDTVAVVTFRDVKRVQGIGNSVRTWTIDTVHCDSAKIYAGPRGAEVLTNLYAGHPAAEIPPCPCPPLTGTDEKGGDRRLQEACTVHHPFANNVYIDGRLAFTADSSSPLLNLSSIDSAYLELHTIAVTGECVTLTVTARPVHNNVSGPVLLTKSYMLDCPDGDGGGGGGIGTGAHEKNGGRSPLGAGDDGTGTTLKVDLTDIEGSIMAMAPLDRIEFTLHVGTVGGGVEFANGVSGEDTRPAIVIGGTYKRPNDTTDYTLAYAYNDTALTATASAKIDDINNTANRFDPAAMHGATIRRTTATSGYGADGRVFRTVVPTVAAAGIRYDTVSHSYTGNGARTQTTDPAGNVTSTLYDALGRPVTITNADGSQSHVAYYQGDPAAFGLSGQNFHGFAAATVTTNENGVKLARYTDAFDKLRREVADSAGMRLTTRYEYDVQGQLSQVVSPKGDTTRYAYDIWGHVRYKTLPDIGTVSYAYDRLGNTRFTITQEQAGRDLLTFNEYDDLNRPTLIGEAAFDHNYNEDTLNPGIHQLKTRRKKAGDAVVGAWEPDDGRRTRDLDPNRLHTGNVVSILTANATLWLAPMKFVPAINPNWGVSNCVQLPADSANLGETAAPVGPLIRMPAQFYGASSGIDADTNDFENIAAHPEFARIAVNYDTLPASQGAIWGGFPATTWDALAPHGALRNQKGREAAIAWRERECEPFNYAVLSYDERGRVEALLRYTDNLGFDAVYYTYNSMNQVASITAADPLRSYTTWYGSDANGRVDSVWTRLSGAGGGLISFFGLKYPNGQTRPDTADIVYRYTKTGTVDSMRYPPANVLVTFAYDHRKWLDSITAKQGAATLFKEVLAYDATGQITSQEWKHGSGARMRQRYAYDSAQRLVRWTQGTASAAPATDSVNYAYDATGNRLGVTKGVNPSESYGYIAGTNRLEDHLLKPGIGNDIASSYQYTGNGAIAVRTRWEQTGTGTWVRGVATEEMGYGWHDQMKEYLKRDGNGALVADWRYRYGAGGEREGKRMYNGPASDAAALYPWVYYLLGGNGEQLAVYHGRQTTSAICSDTGRRAYLYPAEYLTNGVGWNGVREQITQVVTKPNGAKEYQVSDHLASLRVAIEGGTQHHVDYDPWGNQIGGAVAGERLTFNCQEADRETGLYDLSDRNYDPLSGRFTRPDRLLEKFASVSPYGYCANNPVRLTDPTGEQASPSAASNDGDGIPWYLSSASAIIQRAGYASVVASTVRKEYVTRVSSLSKSDYVARRAAKEVAREKTPGEYLAIAEKMRPMADEASRAGGTANKTNTGVNDAMGTIGTAGKVLIGVGVAISIYEIARSNDKFAAAAHEVGGWTGAIAGGEIGAQIGATWGAAFEGVGMVPGAIIGGVVGATMGSVFGAAAVEGYAHLMEHMSLPDPVP